MAERRPRHLVPPALADPASELVLHGPGRDPWLVGTSYVVVLGACVCAFLLQGSARVVGAVAVLVFAAALWLVFVRPALHVDRDGLVVVGAVRTRRLSWDEVDGFDSGVELAVRRRSGGRVPVPALPGRLRPFARGGAGAGGTLPMAAAMALTDRLGRLAAGERLRDPSVVPPGAPPDQDRLRDARLVAVGAGLAVLTYLVLGR